MNEEFLNAYEEIVGKEKMDELKSLAIALQGKKILHINSTKIGGGVAEILERMIPLTQALDLEASWEVIQGDPEFFECTKLFHNAIQGNDLHLTEGQIKHYEETIHKNLPHLEKAIGNADIIFVHDPQPLPLITYFPNSKSKWIWRCHIDASKPNKKIWSYLQNFVKDYDASVFSLAEFVQHLPHPTFVIPPSIDPLSSKNSELSKGEIDQIYTDFNIDPNRPMILQVSRYDRFKDPLGVVEAYRIAKKDWPDLQLVYAGGGASDDPEGDAVLKEVQASAEGDPDVHLLLLPNEASKTVNALQRAADIILQKSTKEGFGLTVTEGLWKGKAVIGGNTGGIRLQISNDETGFLVNTPQEAAEKIKYLLENPIERDRLGAEGKELVKEKFLITRHLRDYLEMIQSLY